MTKSNFDLTRKVLKELGEQERLGAYFVSIGFKQEEAMSLFNSVLEAYHLIKNHVNDCDSPMLRGWLDSFCAPIRNSEKISDL